MTKKQKFAPGKTIKNIIWLIPTLINLVSNITSLLRVRAFLAIRSAAVLLMLSVLFALVLASSWFCLLGMLMVYLLSIHLSWLASLLIVLLSNLLLLLVIIVAIKQAKKNMLP